MGSEKRFGFGKNWQQFLSSMNDTRIAQAEESLRQRYGLSSFKGKTFIDAGCGSGLFSLAAVRLGAERVFSFDYDPDSVAAAQHLKATCLPSAANWHIEKGDVLDAEYLSRLGRFDLVYSWGVLHHTGAMWRAFDNISLLAADDAMMCIAIYNDQGFISGCWKAIKWLYNTLPGGTKNIVLYPVFVRLWGPTILKDAVRFEPLRSWRQYIHQRGISPWRDVIDWVGGYPFEVAKPERLIEYFKSRGFIAEKTILVKGHGNNEFVFRRARR